MGGTNRHVKHPVVVLAVHRFLRWGSFLRSISTDLFEVVYLNCNYFHMV